MNSLVKAASSGIQHIPAFTRFLSWQCCRRTMCRFALPILLLAGAPDCPSVQGQVDFNRDVRPILSDVCFKCHGPDGETRVSEFRLDTKAGLFSTLEDGLAVSPGRPDQSEIVRRITAGDSEDRMPPVDSGRKLTADQIGVLQKWIEEGAKWETHWSFVQPRRPELPATKSADWCRNEVDHFILKRLEGVGLGPSPEVDRRTLIRRVSLDLTGLPPTPQEIAEFLNDKSPNAWERVVDRLLASPRYGERQAIDWLDAARYADTSGYQNDGPRDMWRWRDWVIDAFNSNMPFDRFTVEQLAGDLLPNASLSQKIATGFNRNHRGNAEGGIIPEEYQVEYVVDRVDTTATVWLGLTMGCARCHDHKYDPITQKDFYRTFAFFNNIPESGRAIKEGNSPPYIKAPTDEQEAKLKELDARAAAAARKMRQLKGKLTAEIQAWETKQQKEQLADWTISRGLVAHYRLDGDLRNSAVKADPDVVIPAADSSAEFVAGVVNEAADFRKGAAAEVGNVADFGYFDSFSIAAWVRPAAATGTIVSRMKPVEQGNGYAIHLQDGRVQVNLVKRWLDDSIRVESSRPIKLNEWHHIVVTYDGSRVAAGIQIFINGKLVPVRVKLDGINQSFAAEEPVRIGGGHSSFSGQIDDVHVFNRVVTHNEARVLSDSVSAAELSALPPDKRTAVQTKKLQWAFVDRLASESIRLSYQQAVELRAERNAFFKSLPTVMVMQEMNTPRATFVLKRGRYDAPTERVLPGVPAALPILPDSSPKNRLGFAEWLVSPDHPLTARVAVNRFWQQHFGTGLVKTTEDFGSQGEAPSHPLLLDWLATEFGRTSWDVKALHRLIVSSAAYRQSSRSDPKLQEKDPKNRLLSRGPRFRLSAEFVRDQALFIAGLLKEKTGGPSVRPYQPDGLWKEIASTTEYNQSHGDDLYRRSLYTYWKRTVAPPTMMTLDATSRESCIVKRSRTNTPLQALALMNDVTFVEAARALAERVLTNPADSRDEQIRLAFELATCRPPNKEESAILHTAFNRAVNRFTKNPDAAVRLLSVGESKFDSGIPPHELAAWTALTSMILNLDEVVTLE